MPNPIELILGLLSAGLNQENVNLARAEDEKKFAEGKGVLGGALGDLPGAQQTQGFLTDALSRSAGLSGQIGGQLQDLRSRSLGRVEQIGQQQLRDTGAQFESSRRSALGNLNRQGFASTARAGVSRGFTRDKTQALGRVRQGILQNQLNTDIGTTGMLTNALSQLGTNTANLNFNAFNSVSGQRGNIQSQLASSIFGRNEIPRANIFSDFFTLSQILKPAPKPDEPKPDILGGAISGGTAGAAFGPIGAGIGAGAGAGLALFS